MFSKSTLTLLFLAGFHLVFSQKEPVKKPRVLPTDTVARPVKQKAQDPTVVPTGRGSQILDDSTKNVYGPKTTLWTTEQDLFTGQKSYQVLDTSLINYHRWTYVQGFNNFYQDLGNVGTALGAIFPQASATIGASPGYQSYTPFFDTEEPRYYDTKSPFTRIFVVWGGNGRATTRIDFSRNIKPNWNFGFSYRPILVDKQIQRTRKGDRQTISNYYDFQSSYRSLDNKYLILGSYRRIRHRVNENGGVKLVGDTTINGYFESNVQPYLFAAQSEELKNLIHILHSYKLTEPLQFYQRIDLYRQRNRFTDTKASEINYAEYFKYTNTDPDIDTVDVRDGFELKSITNEMGVKGKASALYYNFYYKFRGYAITNRYLADSVWTQDPKAIEHYLGGQIAVRFDSLWLFSGKAEYLLDGFYKLQANLNTPWLDASAVSSLSKPTFLPSAYRGSHHYWSNSFNSPFFNQLSAFLKTDLGWLFISPGATFTSQSNFIYYRHNPIPGQPQVLPVQSAGIQQLLTPELRMSVRFFKHFYLRPQVLYTHVYRNDDEALRIPTWFINTQLSYENMLFKKAIEVQIGIDAHWRSDYTPLGYDPSIQQFYVQNDFVSPAYPLVDVFLNGKFSRGRFFVKYHNLVQLITQSGYLPTPGYPGKSNVLDFGFDLLIFD